VNEWLSMWVVYERPTDFPDHFVVRRFAIAANEVVAGAGPDDMMLFDTLDAARKRMSEMQLSCLRRHPSDEPQIVEMWL